MAVYWEWEGAGFYCLFFLNLIFYFLVTGLADQETDRPVASILSHPTGCLHLVCQFQVLKTATRVIGYTPHTLRRETTREYTNWKTCEQETAAGEITWIESEKNNSTWRSLRREKWTATTELLMQIGRTLTCSLFHFVSYIQRPLRLFKEAMWNTTVRQSTKLLSKFTHSSPNWGHRK